MTEVQSNVLKEARSWIGTPFRVGSAKKGEGVDCSKFVFEVFHGVGLVPQIEIESPPGVYCMRRNPSVVLAWLDSHPEILSPIGKDLDAVHPCDVLTFYYGRIVHHLAIAGEDKGSAYMCEVQSGVIYTIYTDQFTVNKFHSIYRLNAL